MGRFFLTVAVFLGLVAAGEQDSLTESLVLVVYGLIVNPIASLSKTLGSGKARQNPFAPSLSYSGCNLTLFQLTPTPIRPDIACRVHFVSTKRNSFV